jgi:hypothetical protein
MERLPGEPFFEHQHHLTIEEQCKIVAQLAERVRAMHATPIAALKSFRKAPREWVQLIQARAAQWGVSRANEEFFLRSVPAYLRAQALEFFAENLPYVTEDFHPCLLLVQFGDFFPNEPTRRHFAEYLSLSFH